MQESSKTEKESDEKKEEKTEFSIENSEISSNTVDGCVATIEPPQSEVEISSLPSPLFDFEDASELEADLEMMIQSAAGPFQHHRSGQNYGATNSAFRQSGFHHHHHHPQVNDLKFFFFIHDVQLNFELNIFFAILKYVYIYTHIYYYVYI